MVTKYILKGIAMYSSTSLRTVCSHSHGSNKSVTFDEKAQTWATFAYCVNVAYGVTSCGLCFLPFKYSAFIIYHHLHTYWQGKKKKVVIKYNLLI